VVSRDQVSRTHLALVRCITPRLEPIPGLLIIELLGQ
jgi:hypothetical protein